MPSDLLKFLFNESQREAALRQALEEDAELVKLLEAAENEEKLEIKATPLIKALKDTLDLDGEMEVYPDGVKLKLDNEDTYNLYRQKLAQPDVVAKLAELGWVVFFGGDVNAMVQPACYVLKFLELTTAVPTTKEAEKLVGNGSDQAKWDKYMRGAAEKGLSQSAPDPQGTYGPDELPDPKTYKKEK